MQTKRSRSDRLHRAYPPTALRRAHPPATAALLLVGAFVAGCQSLQTGGGDSILANVLEPFKAEDPSDLARDMFDVSDADKRRHAVAQFSAASFGGEETYLRTYRLLLGGETTENKPKIVGAPDSDATVRAAAVKALGLHGTVDDVAIILPRLDDDVPFVRWEAAKALTKIHNPIAIRPLMRKLHEHRPLGLPQTDTATNERRGDDDPDVRRACAAALGQYATPGVFDGLVGALDDGNYRVSYAARQSLVTLTGYDLGPEPGDWLLWAKKNRKELFKHQKIYTWQPYKTAKRLIDKVQFWKDDKPVPSRVPTGKKISARSHARDKS